jgi:hypothetical protein
MGEPTISSMSYGSMEVNSVTVHAAVTQELHAATKAYVDSATLAVRDSIVSGAGPAMDTLREIETFLQGDSSNVSAGLVNQLSSLQAQLTGEIARAMAVDQDHYSSFDVERNTRQAAVANLQSIINYESGARQTNVLEINEKTAYLENRANTLSQQHYDDDLRLTAEIAARIEAGSSLQGQLAQSVVEVNTRVDTELALKLDKTGGAVSGDLNIAGEVYIGPHWKIVAQGTSLVFMYSADSESGWGVGIPFISV